MSHTTPKLAVLLAAGRGKRLRPWTDTTPKPLLPVNGQPTIDFTLTAAKKAGITHIIFIVGHLGEQIIDYVGDGAQWDIAPYFCEQKELLGTAHALKQAVNAFPDLFATNDAFILTATDYLFEQTVLLDLIEKQTATNADIVISLKELPLNQLSSRSSVRYTGEFELEEIVEKPAEGQAPSPYSTSLLYLLPSKIVDLLPQMTLSERGEYEIQNLINALLQNGSTGRGVLQPSPAEWEKPS